MLKYDPNRTPKSAVWLSAGEQERIDAVMTWHLDAGIELPNHVLHAVFHVTVENQLAEGLDSVVRAIPRLMKQGLSRHDAVHAVASVLSEHMFYLMNNVADPSETRALNARYDAQVNQLTAQDWLSMAEEDEEDRAS